jgi:hypothetical protein
LPRSSACSANWPPYRDEIERMKDVLDFETHFVLSEPQPGWQGSIGELTPDVLKTCLDEDNARWGKQPVHPISGHYREPAARPP